MAIKTSKFDNVDYYDDLSWKPRVGKCQTHELWYVSRRRKKYDPEYLSLDSQWQDWAVFFTSEADAEAAKTKAFENWQAAYQQSKAKHQ